MRGRQSHLETLQFIPRAIPSGEVRRMKSSLRTWAADFRVVLPVALCIALALRIAWPLADPPPTMSWSTGAYTDPASNALAARYEVERQEAAIEVPERFIYPALHSLARVAYQTLGVRRLSTVTLAALLGTATVALLALAVRRGPGPHAAILVAVLGATNSWLAPNTRVLTAEGVALVLLAIACFFAMSRRAVAWLAAGAFAAAAGFLGKYQALAFLPALFLFLGMRIGWRAAGIAFLGAFAVGAAWTLAIFLPHRAEIIAWIRQSSVGFAESSRVGILPQHGLLAPFKALKDSWLSLRAPIVTIAGCWFILRTLGTPGLLRGRIQDGSALFVFWAVLMSLGISLFSYAAPRYFMLVAAPLVACVAGQIEFLRTPPAHPRQPMRSVALFLFFWIASFVVLHWLVRVQSTLRTHFYLEEWVRDPTSIPLLFTLPEAIQDLDRHVVVALILGALATSFVLIRRRRNRKAAASPTLHRAKRLAPALFVAVVGFDSAVWGMWASQRTWTIELAKTSLREILPSDAVILGAFAPLLTEGSSMVAVPHFGQLQEADLMREPRPTHLLLYGGDAANLQASNPILPERSVPVARWSIRTAWARDLVLFRLLPMREDPPYQLSLYERAIEQLLVGATAEATALAAEYRNRHGETLTQIQLEASCNFHDEASPKAETLFRRATELNPVDPIPYRNLGWIALRRGDEAEARALMMKALEIDPSDPEMMDLVRPLLLQKAAEAPADSVR
jgi:hypothetical protein